MKKLDRFGEEHKGERRKRTSADRFAWHACWHNDAWIGVDDLSAAATGVYWKLILRMYMKRAALPDNDAANARLFNVSPSVYRRLKAELIAAGRVIVDAENGLIFDDRAMRELVAAERYSDAQQERAKKRWKPARKTPKVHRVEGSNVVMIAPDEAQNMLQIERQTGAGIDAGFASILTPISAPTPEQNQTHSVCRGAFSAYAGSDAGGDAGSMLPKPKPKLSNPGGPNPSSRAALPPDGGGAPKRDKGEWLTEQRQGLGLEDESLEVAGDTPGDRKANVMPCETKACAALGADPRTQGRKKKGRR